MEWATIELPTGTQHEQETITLASGDIVQVCRTRVLRDGGAGVPITLLLDAQGLAMPSDADIARFRSAAQEGVAAGVLATETGKVTVFTLPEFQEKGEEIALAAAVCAASWGWDESESIRVSVNQLGWDVTPKFWNGAWTARIVSTLRGHQSVRGRTWR